MHQIWKNYAYLNIWLDKFNDLINYLGQGYDFLLLFGL